MDLRYYGNILDDRLKEKAKKMELTKEEKEVLNRFKQASVHFISNNIFSRHFLYKKSQSGTYFSSDKWDAIDEPGVAAQGNSNPLAVFADHALVQKGTQIYDPSYGTGPFTGILDWVYNDNQK